MVITDKVMKVSPQQVANILQTESNEFGSYFDYDRIVEYISFHKLRLAQEMKYFYSISNDFSYTVTKRVETINMLKSKFGVSAGAFGQNGTTLDKEVINMLVESYPEDTAIGQFIRKYKQATHDSYMISYLGQYEALEKVRTLSYENHRMVLAHPKWKVASTSRILGSDPSVQNVPKEFADIVTAPKGYQLIFSDSGQIEPRITYSVFLADPVIKHLITMYDDAYYGLMHFISMDALERASAYENVNNIIIKPVTDEMVIGRKILKVLALAGNYGSSNLDAIDPVLGPLYDQFVVKHPIRLQLERDIRSAVRSGVSTFYGAFGTPVTPDETSQYKKGGPGWFEHVVRCGINNPVQTTASELMCFSVDRATHLLAGGAKGHINYYKHDEGSFYVLDDYVDELKPKLRDCVSYQIEGWIPIGSDLVVGRKEGFRDTMLFRQWNLGQ